MDMTSNCDVTKTVHHKTNDHHMPLNETSHENFLRTPLNMRAQPLLLVRRKQL